MRIAVILKEQYQGDDRTICSTMPGGPGYKPDQLGYSVGHLTPTARWW
jgi:hypothetical protein